jgi:hypothetical protein
MRRSPRNGRSGHGFGATISAQPRANFIAIAATAPFLAAPAASANTSLFWSNVALHGTFELDLGTRLDYDGYAAGAHHVVHSRQIMACYPVHRR